MSCAFRRPLPFGVLLIGIALLISACSEDDISGPAPVDAERVAELPSVLFTQPARADYVFDGWLVDTPVQVRVAATEEGEGLQSLLVNGEEILAEPGATEVDYSFEHEARWGLSILRALATDAGGELAYTVQSFLRSPAWYPEVDGFDDRAKVRTAQSLQLNQEGLDDHDRQDVDDVATVMEMALNGQLGRTLINSQLPRTIWSRGPLSARLMDISWRHANLWLTLGEGGFYSEVNFLDVEIDVRVKYDGALKDYTETVTFRAEELTIGTFNRVRLVGDNLEIKATSVSADINLNRPSCPFPLGVGCGTWDDAVEAIAGSLEYYIEGAVEDMIDGIGGEVFARLVTPDPIVLPAPIDAQLQLNWGLQTVDFTRERALFDLDFQMFTPAPEPSLTEKGAGAIRNGGPPPAFSTSDYSTGFGVKDDFLNQVLWATWRGGGFHLDVPPDYYVGGILSQIGLKVEALAPPVIMPGRGGNDVDVGWGDIRIEIDMGTFAGRLPESLGCLALEDVLVLHASFVSGGTIDLDPETGKLRLTTLPDIQLFVEASGSDDPDCAMAVNRFLVRELRMILPPLIADVIASIPPPQLRLRDISSDLPDLTLFPQGEIDRIGIYTCATGGFSNVQ